MRTRNLNLPDRMDCEPDYTPEQTFKTCDFCGEKINQFDINWDIKDGKNTGVVYCDDCKEEYQEWKKESDKECAMYDTLFNFGTFTDKLCQIKN